MLTGSLDGLSRIFHYWIFCTQSLFCSFLFLFDMIFYHFSFDYFSTFWALVLDFYLIIVCTPFPGPQDFSIFLILIFHYFLTLILRHSDIFTSLVLGSLGQLHVQVTTFTITSRDESAGQGIVVSKSKLCRCMQDSFFTIMSGEDLLVTLIQNLVEEVVSDASLKFNFDHDRNCYVNWVSMICSVE